jgi:hypothetical protein
VSRSTTIGPSPVPDRVILGMHWHGAEPFVRVRDIGEPHSRLEMLQGASLEFRVASDRPGFCLGRPTPTGGDFYECANRPTSVNRRCTPCSVAHATYAASLHHAHTRRLVRDTGTGLHLLQPNVLYVAGFRDGSIKVGTSNAGRIITRLHEQGAWRAVVCTDAVDGYVVREAEDAVTATLALPQSVSMSRKLHGLVRPVDDGLLGSRIDRAVDGIHELVAGIEGLTPVRRPWAYGPTRPWQHVVRYPADVATGAHELRVRSVCGRAVLADAPDGDEHPERLVFDIARLFGHRLQWGRHGSPPIVIQGSLF